MQIVKEKFSCKNGEYTISGKLFKPDRGSNFPIAVLCHGFMANMTMCLGYAKLLAEKGYAAFCFDFVGGGVACKSDGKTETMSVLTECSDLECVISYVSALDFTDPSHLLLLGCSQGGLVTSLVAGKLQSKVEKLILLYPALSIPSDARKGNMLGMKFDTANIPDKLHFGPMSIGKKYVTDVINMDVYSQISQYHGNVLIIHGTKDGIVDISYSREALEKYKAAGASAELMEIKGGAHAFPVRRHDNAAKKKIAEFVGSANEKE